VVEMVTLQFWNPWPMWLTVRFAVIESDVRVLSWFQSW